MRMARGCLALFAVLLTLSGCYTWLTSFAVPPRVWAGQVFEAVLEGGAGGSTLLDAMAIMQLPDGFVVEGAVALSSGVVVPSVSIATSSSTIASEPGHYQAWFSGRMPSTLSGAQGVTMKVYIRAPQTVGGLFSLKVVTLDTSGPALLVNSHPGVTSFAAVTNAPYVQPVTVVADPISPFVIDTRGLLTSGMHAAGTGVALGDIDGDGNDDLAYSIADQSFRPPGTVGFSGGPAPGTLAWLSRPGAAWVPRNPLRAGSGLSHLRVAFGDFDGDGHQDVADTAGWVQFSNGGSSWSWGPTLPLIVPQWGGVAVGDVDGDGLDDVAFSAFSTDAIQVFRGRPDRTFTEWITGLPRSTNGILGADRLMLQDVSGDGLCDLVASGAIGSRVWFGDGRGGWTPANAGLPPFGDFGVEDLDRNGLPELVVTSYPDAVVVLEFVGGIWRRRSMSGAPSFTFPRGTPATALAVLDHDRDGWPDVAVSYGGNPNVVLLRNLTGQSWDTPVHLTALAAYGGITDFAVGDVDGDTWPDLAAASVGEHPIVWRNTGSGLSPYGEPCSAMGFPTPSMGASGTLQIGSGSFAFELSGAQPNSGAVLWIGLSRRFAFGQPLLPFGLGPLGAPGCAVVASTEAPHFVLADPTGLARVPIAIPNDPALKRLTVFAQGAALAPGANGLGWLLSGGLAAKIP